MTWTLIQHGANTIAGSGTQVQVILTNPVTSGNLIWCQFTWGDTSTPSITDDKGNSYTIVDNVDENTIGLQSAAQTGLVNITNGPSTFNLNNSPATSFRDLVVQEWSCTGGPSAGIDQHTGRVQLNIANAGGFSSGAVTTGVNGELVLAGACSSTASVPASAGSGYTAQDTQGGQITESQIQSSAGSIDGTFVNNTGATASFLAVIMTFQPASTISVGKTPSGLLLPPRRGMVGWRGLRQVRAFPVSNIPIGLSGAGLLAVKGSAAPTGSAAMAGRGGVMLKAQAGPSGKVPIAGQSLLAVKATDTMSLAAALGARAALQAKAQAAAAGNAAMAARAALQVKAQAGPSGAVGLAGRATAQVKAAGVIVFAAFLSARAQLMVTAAGATNVAAALSARAATMVKAAAGPSGAVGLAGRAATAVKAGGTIVFGGVVALTGAITLMAKAAASAAGNVALGGKATLMTKGNQPVSGTGPIGAVVEWLIRARRRGRR